MRSRGLWQAERGVRTGVWDLLAGHILHPHREAKTLIAKSGKSTGALTPVHSCFQPWPMALTHPSQKPKHTDPPPAGDLSTGPGHQHPPVCARTDCQQEKSFSSKAWTTLKLPSGWREWWWKCSWSRVWPRVRLWGQKVVETVVSLFF